MNINKLQHALMLMPVTAVIRVGFELPILDPMGPNGDLVVFSRAHNVTVATMQRALHHALNKKEYDPKKYRYGVDGDSDIGIRSGKGSVTALTAEQVLSWLIDEKDA